MIVLTLKTRTPRPGFQVPAERPRPIRFLGQGASVTLPDPADNHDRGNAASPADATYLRRWIAHQATTYNSLLETIAAAPAPHSKRNP